MLDWLLQVVCRNSKWQAGERFYRRGLLGNELTFLVECLDKVLLIGVSMVVFLGSLNMVIKWSMGPYSCQLCRICWKYAEHILTTHRPGIPNATPSLVTVALFVPIEPKFHDILTYLHAFYMLCKGNITALHIANCNRYVV